jgi:hypothetical protein
MTFLIKKPMNRGDIVTIKLTSAEELIARLDADTPTHYEISRPMTLSYSQQGIALTPWLITADNDSNLQIVKERVMVITTTMKQAADQYIQGTTGIQTVNKL